MAATLLGSLLVSLGLNSGAFRSGLSDAEKQMRATQKNFERIGGNFQKVGAALSVGITAPFTALVAKSIPAAIESQQATAQVTAALKSMGPVAGRTADQLANLAGRLQDTSNFDDDDIMKSVTANLLTFGKVSGDVFDRAEQAAVDLSARLGQDLQSSAIQLGKALNDPIKGVSALQRVGVSFTAEQKEQIKAMVEAGNVAGAQKLILGELEKQFGGAAKAQRDATPGAASQQAWRTFQENVGAVALKVLPRLTDGLAAVLNVFNALSPRAQTVAIGIGAMAAAGGPALIVAGSLVKAWGQLLPVFSALALRLGLVTAAEGEATVAAVGFGAAIGVAMPWLLAIAGASAAVYAAFQHWDEIAPILSGVSNAITAALGPPLQQLFGTVKGAFADLWSGPFGDDLRSAIDELSAFGSQIAGAFGMVAQAAVNLGAGIASAFGPAFLGIFKAMADVIGTAFAVIGNLVGSLSALLHGNFKSAFAYAGRAVESFALGFAKAITDLIPNVLESLRRMVVGIGQVVVGELGRTWDSVKTKVAEVGDAFFRLYDRVVGHSYVPDMVDEIGQHVGRLDTLLVAPILSATAKAGDAFAELRGKVQSILDELFPEQAAVNDLHGKLDALDQAMADHLIKPAVWKEARDRLVAQLFGAQEAAAKAGQATPAGAIDGSLGGKPSAVVAPDVLADETENMFKRVKVANDGIVESWAGMARDVASSLQGLVSNIKSGNWLGALSSVLDVVRQVAAAIHGTGAPAKATYQVNGLAGARAMGGPVLPNASYLVGERGPEILRMGGAGGSIVPNHMIGGPSIVQVHVVANDYFDARVGQVSGGVTATAINGAQRNVATRNRQSLVA